MMNYINCKLYLLCISFIIYVRGINAVSVCGDWILYKDEKCFKIFTKLGLQSYEDAEYECHKQDNESTLISIRNQDEQNFITEILKTYNIADNIWIDVKYTYNEYRWSDGSNLDFTNWAEGSPKNRSDHCVQVQTDETAYGQWSDPLCTKKNLVACQRIQTWSISELQKIVLSMLNTQMPIGFIYFQLPNEKAPAELWPMMTWSDVSTAYAGVFFRVMGGGAAPFGQVQDENVPRIEEVITGNKDSAAKPLNDYNRNVSLPKTGWGNAIPTSGECEGNNRCYINFKYSSIGEVRPRNMAIRVWKRTG